MNYEYDNDNSDNTMQVEHGTYTKYGYPEDS